MNKKLPSVFNDKGFIKDSEDYANKVFSEIKLCDIKKALSLAYLKGAQSSIRIGYSLAEK